MKRVLIRASIAVVAFLLGIAAASIWISTRPSKVATSTLSKDCTPQYDANLVAKQIRENDDPDLFRAFQQLPLYALPDCVDEAYSLTWIPSFHAPVFVQVWRAGDQAFIVAKALDSKGWSKFGNVRESNSRPLTKFEWRDFSDLLSRASYWQLPETVDEIVPQDGAVWLLDGLRSKQYHWARRRVPKEQYSEICKHLIRLSGLETAHALYLP
jgi:hypothetical protein